MTMPSLAGSMNQSYPPQIPNPVPPFTPMQTYQPLSPPISSGDIDKACKLLTWFNSSGLTAEELDALANLKKNGKDIDSILGIKRSDSKEDLDSMKNDIKELREMVTSLITSLNEPVKTTNS